MVCVPPKYPGVPEDYEYVAEHCRKTSHRTKTSNLKKRLVAFKTRAKDQMDIAKKRLAEKPAVMTGSPGLDEYLKTLVKIQQATPRYIRHMFTLFTDDKMIERYPEPEARWAQADKRWKGIEIPDEAYMKYEVALMSEKIL